MTGKHLKIRPMGSDVLGVELEGNKAKPEPIHFRVMFQGGDVDVVRTSTDDYWIHVRVNKEGQGLFMPGEDVEGHITDARLDITSKHTRDVNVGDFDNPELYHLAVRVSTRKEVI